MKNIGKPCAGKPHARFDEGGLGLKLWSSYLGTGKRKGRKQLSCACGGKNQFSTLPGFISTMTLWLRRCGFKDIACVDTNRTSIEEQRQTEWMKFESLVDYLDPEDHSKTIEGYPAPLRAIFIAAK